MQEKGKLHNKSQIKNQITFANKYDDWTCLLCQNHNYSFRIICNRCKIQTKEQNAYLNFLYEEQLRLAEPTEANFQLMNETYYGEYFPQVLFLTINNEPWEQQPQRRETCQNINVKWINNLFQE